MPFTNILVRAAMHPTSELQTGNLTSEPVRTKEHASCDESAISAHLSNCTGVEHIFNLFNAFENDVDVNDFKLKLVRQNTSIIDQCNNWNVLLFKEAFHIKEKKSFSEQ